MQEQEWLVVCMQEWEWLVVCMQEWLVLCACRSGSYSHIYNAVWLIRIHVCRSGSATLYACGSGKLSCSSSSFSMYIIHAGVAI